MRSKSATPFVAQWSLLHHCQIASKRQRWQALSKRASVSLSREQKLFRVSCNGMTNFRRPSPLCVAHSTTRKPSFTGKMSCCTPSPQALHAQRERRSVMAQWSGVALLARAERQHSLRFEALKMEKDDMISRLEREAGAKEERLRVCQDDLQQERKEKQDVEDRLAARHDTNMYARLQAEALLAIERQRRVETESLGARLRQQRDNLLCAPLQGDSTLSAVASSTLQWRQPLQLAFRVARRYFVAWQLGLRHPSTASPKRQSMPHPSPKAAQQEHEAPPPNDGGLAAPSPHFIRSRSSDRETRARALQLEVEGMGKTIMELRECLDEANKTILKLRGRNKQCCAVIEECNTDYAELLLHAEEWRRELMSLRQRAASDGRLHGGVQQRRSRSADVHPGNANRSGTNREEAAKQRNRPHEPKASRSPAAAPTMGATTDRSTLL